MHASTLQAPASAPGVTLYPSADATGPETKHPGVRLRQALRTGKEPIRVLLVDDHPVVRRGLTFCLSRLEGLMVVGEATDGREALQKAKELSPDIVLMDIDMPVMNGLTATELLKRDRPAIKVIVLSMHSRPEYVLRILQSGANGYVLKDAAPEELLKAIETVHAKGSYFSSQIALVALNRFVKGQDEAQCEQISPREREVLVAIAEGLSNKEIAARLSVGVRTVETHRERMMRKLNIRSIAGLTKFAIQQGLVPMPKVAGG